MQRPFLSPIRSILVGAKFPFHPDSRNLNIASDEMDLRSFLSMVLIPYPLRKEKCKLNDLIRTHQVCTIRGFKTDCSTAFVRTIRIGFVIPLRSIGRLLRSRLCP